jgi:hypothetical protein
MFFKIGSKEHKTTASLEKRRKIKGKYARHKEGN